MYPLLDLLRPHPEGFPYRPLANVGGGAPQNDLLMCRVEEDPDVALLHVTGEVDLYTAPVLRMYLRQLVEKGKDIVVVLTEVQYIDMAGIRALEDGLELAKQGHARLLLASPSPIARRLFEIVDLDHEFAILPTKVAALTQLRVGRSADRPPRPE